MTLGPDLVARLNEVQRVRDGYLLSLCPLDVLMYCRDMAPVWAAEICMLEDRVAELEAALADADERCADIETRYPALERWRRRTLETGRATPQERTAAWELTALSCELTQDDEHAIAARDCATRTLSRRSA